VKVPPALRSKDAIAILLLLLIATLFLADVLAGTSKLYLRDLTRYYYPTKRIVREVILGGELPFWNRYYSAGQPMAANPEYEVFYPPQWLILLPNYDLGYRLHILLHVYIALAGMYALLRSMELRVESSFLGSLSFGLGGVYLSLVNLLPLMFCAAWMPWIFLCARRFLLRPNPRDFIKVALLAGLQMLAGEPTTMVQTWALIGFYALYRAWYQRGRFLVQSLKMSALTGLMLAAGIAVGAAQIIPAFDHVRDSVRSRPFDFSLVTAWSMPFARPLELLFPNVLGHFWRKGAAWYWAGGLYPGMGSSFLFSIYMGLLAAAMIVGGIFARPRGGRLVLLIVSLSTLLALGGNTPLLRGLYSLGVASAVRYPEKFALMGLFTLLVFAAMMLDRLLAGDQRVAEGATGFVLGTTLFSILISVVAFTPLYGRGFGAMWGQKASPTLEVMISLSRADWVICSVKGVALLALLWLVRRRAPTRAWVVAAAVFALTDLLTVTYEILPRMPRNFFNPPPVVKTLRADRARYRVFHEVDWYGDQQVAREWFSTGHAVYWIVRNGLFPMTTATWGYSTVLERDYDKTLLLPTVDLVESLWKVKGSGRKDWREIFSAMSNAEYRSEYRLIAGEKKRVGGRMKDAQPVNFVPMEVSPRYYFADHLETIRDKADFVEKLTSRSWSRRTGFVQGPAFSPARGTVVSAREGANSATIDVRSEAKSFLIASVTPHKYWRATIDGEPAALQVVNLGYQGIIVPPGRHTIRMRYRNELVLWSLAISILATAGGLLTLVRLGRSRRPGIKHSVTLSEAKDPIQSHEGRTHEGDPSLNASNDTADNASS